MKITIQEGGSNPDLVYEISPKAAKILKHKMVDALEESVSQLESESGFESEGGVMIHHLLSSICTAAARIAIEDPSSIRGKAAVWFWHDSDGVEYGPFGSKDLAEEFQSLKEGR